MRKYIQFPRSEGKASRQAHAGFPKGTYEREMSKEGFFGPAAFLHHRRPPTGWTSFEGPLRPRAFDLARLNAPTPSPWAAATVLHNARGGAVLEARRAMPPWPATPTATSCCSSTRARATSSATTAAWPTSAGDYLYLPRGTMWRLEPAEPATAILMIEATNTHYKLPDRGLMGGHALFDPAMLETPAMDDAFRAHQDEAGECPGGDQEARRGLDRDLSPTIRWTPWAGTATWRRCG